MLDPKRLRAEADAVAAQLARRGYVFDLERFNAMESLRRELQVQFESARAKMNALAKEIGLLKIKGQNASELQLEATGLSKSIQPINAEMNSVLDAIDGYSLDLPNIPDASVPDGKDENENVELRKWGRPRAHDGARDHAELGEALGQMDFAAAAKLTGSRFVILRGQLARLQRALTQFMLDVHTTEHGYEELYVPYIVNAASLRGTGQLPKFGEDLFALKGEQDWFLIPTAEVPVTNLLRDEIVDVDSLPRKWVAHTPCFRSEAGSAGRDTKGMIRQHQFEKVELVQATRPEDSAQAHEELTAHAEAILQKLELPYRVVALCAGDLGFSAAKTYDIEVWLPSQNRYREISSCSNFGDFQARRMQARYRNPATKKTELLHTLNGSALAVGRTLVAILENYQNTDGSVAVPFALRGYIGGLDRVG